MVSEIHRTFADLPMIDIVGAAILLVARILIVLWGLGKVFKLGLLGTGQPPKILESIRMVQAKY